MITDADIKLMDEFYANTVIIGGDPDWTKSANSEPDDEDIDDGESLDDVIDRLIETGSAKKPVKKTDLSVMTKAAKKAKVERDPVFQRMLDKHTPTLTKKIASWLKADGKRISAILVEAMFPAKKVDASTLGSVWLRKALTQAQIDAIVDNIDLDGMRLLAGIITDNSVEVFKTAYLSGAAIGGMVVDMNLVTEETVAYARARAAEMVGMVVVDGKVVSNPNPAWSISEATRTMLRADVTKAIASGSSAADLEKAIESNYAFSDTRALNIARTELSNAFNQGSIDGWRNSGVKVYKRSLLSDSYDVEDECGVAARDGAIPLDKAFSNGKMSPAYHPNCRCSLSPVVQKEKTKGKKVATKADLSVLMKANPNHDQKTGQFTSGAGGAGAAGSRKGEAGKTFQTGRQKSMGEQMISAIKTGGFTMTAKGKALMDGYSVGEFPERSLSCGSGALRKQMVEMWLKKNKDLLSSGQYHVGGWDDTKGKSKKYWLDIVRVYPSTSSGKMKAVASGVKKNQVGIANLNAIAKGDWDNAIINTHGTGAAKTDLGVLMKTVDRTDKTVASRLYLFDNAATADDIFSALTGGEDK